MVKNKEYCKCDVPDPDIGGTYCNKCQNNLVYEEEVENLISEEENGNVVYDQTTISEGLKKKLGNSETPDRRVFVKSVGALITIAGAVGGPIAAVELYKNSAEYETALAYYLGELENALVSRNQVSNLVALKQNVPANFAEILYLIDAALLHGTGNLLAAEIAYEDMYKNIANLSPDSQILIYRRFAKVLNNIGNHDRAVDMLDQPLQQKENLSDIQFLDLCRNKLNGIYMSDQGSTRSNRSGNQITLETKINSVLHDVYDYFGVGTIEEIDSRHDVLKSGISLFKDVVEFTKNGKDAHLKNHLDRIFTMIHHPVGADPVTGWNRYSQFIALALSKNNFDFAEQGLLAAFSYMDGSSLKFDAATKNITSIAKDNREHKFKHGTGSIDEVLHWAMWAQYGYARIIDGSSIFDTETVGHLFNKSRAMLDRRMHKRFIRSIDRLMDANGFDPLENNGSLKGRLRSVGPEYYSDHTFFPLTPKIFESERKPTQPH